MAEDPNGALQVGLAYFNAWATEKDLDRAMSYVSEDIVADAPGGRIEGAEAFRANMSPFVESLVGSELIAAFGDGRTALLMWEASTDLVKNETGAACLTVEDGKITQNRGVFDRLPFRAARGEIS